ncbi:MAG TPA: nucleotidyltransferase family protein [Terriglobales bacterium]|jgi:molybdenum cofactor cytidylyltransferase|nr:nucleotidyltransferase family protein [Terriglobales bacterium]
MARSPNFAGLILAAGDSSRMGRDKALLPWRGKTFLAAAIESLAPHTELVIVVAGKNSESLKPIIYPFAGVYLVENPTPELGQFSSLQIGLREVLNHGRDAAIVTLVDRPPAQPATVEKLLDRFLQVVPLGWWAVIPEFNGHHGHPIVVGREMIEAFLKAPASSTAREIEHSLQKIIDYFPVSDPAVTTNINTPEEYEQLQR